MSRRSATGWMTTLACLAGGGLLLIAPPELQERLRGMILDGLRPGLQTVANLRETRETALPVHDLAPLHTQIQTLTSERDQALLQQRRLQAELARLRSELDDLQATRPAPFQGETGKPLFVPDLLGVRVLDSAAPDELNRTLLTLDQGESARVALAEWVLGNDAVTIDQGRDAGMTPDAPVLSGRGVFGRIASCGQFTSRVQHLSDPGFKAHARLVRVSGQHIVRGAEGLLVGSGNGTCQLTLIPGTEPVDPGDLVYTAGTIPGVDEDLSMGTVTSAELAPGASHWTIEVTPVLPIAKAERLQVVRIGINPARDTDPKTATAPRPQKEAARTVPEKKPTAAVSSASTPARPAVTGPAKPTPAPKEPTETGTVTPPVEEFDEGPEIPLSQPGFLIPPGNSRRLPRPGELVLPESPTSPTSPTTRLAPEEPRP